MRKQRALPVIVILLLVLVPSAVSQRSKVAKMFPVYENGGKPDLVVDPLRFVSQMQIVDRRFEDSSCALAEKAVGGKGYRRVLRFNTVVINSGDGDLVLGARNDPNNPFAKSFEFAPCHGHFHVRDFSIYELLSLDRQTVVASHKQGFCVEDSLKYGSTQGKGFNCEFQGISSGWGDRYSRQLTGQWIDITDVPAGDYILRVRINPENLFDEGENRYTNALETSIQIPDPRKKVTIDDSPDVIAK
jgi:hypothetical protein